jgi:hypothetical protein
VIFLTETIVVGCGLWRRCVKLRVRDGFLMMDRTQARDGYL